MQLLRLSVYTLFIGLILFAESVPVEWIRAIEGTVAGWMVVSIELALLCFLLFINWQKNVRCEKKEAGSAIVSTKALFGITALAVLAVVIHLKDGPVSSQLFRCSLLLGGMLVGQAILLLWQMTPIGERKASVSLFPCLIIITFVAAPFVQNENTNFAYSGRNRWTGPWDNPNTFGLLVAVGLIVLLGQSLYRDGFSGLTRLFSRKETSAPPISVRLNKIFWILSLLAGGILMVALVKSYSRGAWVAGSSGLAYLLFARKSILSTGLLQRLWKNRLPLFLCILAGGLLAIEGLKNLKSAATRRVTSVRNVNDFSWRNRVKSYIGALQIISEEPLFGWGQREPDYLYAEFYRTGSPTSVDTSILLNDYPVFAISFGLVALGLFAGLQTVALKSARQDCRELGITIIARAACVVLLVGFFFDGGLFKMPTGATLAIFSTMLMLRWPTSNEPEKVLS